jgi:hypothetical protein
MSVHGRINFYSGLVSKLEKKNRLLKVAIKRLQKNDRRFKRLLQQIELASLSRHSCCCRSCERELALLQVLLSLVKEENHAENGKAD